MNNKTSTQPNTSVTVPLESNQINLMSGGGKAANLSMLANSNFPVKPGFVIPTYIYQQFTWENGIDEKIDKTLSQYLSDNDSEKASRKIRGLFSPDLINEKVRSAILTSYKLLENPSIAVRSSATTEDLPETSFAGQQDTFLNVKGDAELLKAVVDCWGSLWTARAIDYRQHNGIDHNAAFIAVIVQEMVQSEISGVLFTADPLTGLRTQTVIDATFGLGEALVSGMVEPDHYTVDNLTKKIIAKTVGKKSTVIQSSENGGTHIVNQENSSRQALSDNSIIELAKIGDHVQVLFGSPQDVEWAVENGHIYLLQSRPITTLYPLPKGLPYEPLKVLVSFAAVQGMLAPISPLGISTLKYVFASLAGLFGIRVTEKTQTILYEAGQRLWINFTPLIKNSVGQKIIPAVFDQVEPTVKQAIQPILDNPELQPGKPGISWHARAQIARFVIPTGFNVFLNMLSPTKRRGMIVENGERILQILDQRINQIEGNRYEKLSKKLDLLPYIAENYLPHTFILFVSGIAAGMASWNLLRMIIERSQSKEGQPDINGLVLDVTRGMPHNPTTEMDLALWKIAESIQKDSSINKVYKTKTSAELKQLYEDHQMPAAIARQLDNFLGRYGGRGLGEIDIGSRRWGEDPLHLFEMLSSYLQIDDASRAPDRVFSESVEAAERSIEKIKAIVRQSGHGKIKSRLVKLLAGRTRQLMGLRESPKFFVVRLFWRIHQEMLKSGLEFVENGIFTQPGDVFFLTRSELYELASGKREDEWPGIIQDRRAKFEQEQKRRQIPRLLLSNGRAFYEGIDTKSDTKNSLAGSPVSPGSVEGLVRVILDPRKANLKPGEIMVCPGTDPSWTPLFMTAVGLVMETGGMMTHGAVVAREYGIPAIVGVDKATQRLRTGQKIRMDGSTGKILILDEN